MDAIPYLAAASALLGLLLAGFFFKNVKAADPGNDRMVFLMIEIQKGAKAFLKKEYSWVSVFVIAMAILIASLIAPAAAVTYVIGASLSALAGYIGMTVATMANARTTQAAKDGPGRALPIAFRGGAVMGFSVAGLALLGLMAVYIVFVLLLEVDDALIVERITGRRTDPDTGTIYHMTFNPPPAEILDRLVQRSDDTAEACAARLSKYHQDTAPIIPFYEERSILRRVDGVGNPDDVTARLIEALG